jgi:endonuclease/exonuclease/phosphatase family metal-dependent hydrolase
MNRNRKRVSLTWTSKILLGINLLVIFALLLSYLAPVVNPVYWTIPSLFGLFYPVVLIINILFLLWWLLRLKWIFLIPLLSILIGWGILSKHFAFGTNKAAGSNTSEIRVVSYNVRIFNVHNWHVGDEPAIRDSIIKGLKKIDADIVCFQEFFHGEKNYFPTVQPVILSLNTPNVHSDFILSGGRTKHFGLATFSKYPIVNKGIIHFTEAKSNSGIFTDLRINDDTIRILNIHLESIKFSSSDHQYVADFIEPGTHPGESSTKVIFSKIRNAFEKRSAQAKTVNEYIEASPYPVILCGDFNDTPSSFAYNKVKGDLKDAFLESGFGFSSTYAGKIPFLRIDYILHSRELNSSDFQKHQVKFSDHYPISASFEFEK